MARRSAANELVFERLLDAPRELAFAAWTDPKQIGCWWGPHGFTTTTIRIEVKVGGVWEYVMHGPDGTDYPNRAIYLEVDRPNRLVLSNIGGRADDPHLTCEMTATFEDAAGKTKFALRMKFDSPMAADQARKNGAEAGGDESMERLSLYLSTSEVSR